MKDDDNENRRNNSCHTTIPFVRHDDSDTSSLHTSNINADVAKQFGKLCAM